MAEPPVISEAQISRGASPESFERGRAYFRRGAVGDLLMRGDTLHADVEGSEPAPYRVTVRLDPGGVSAASCTCPYDWGGWCKHIVAALLAYAKTGPGAVERRPPLAEQLAGLDREQLAGLILRLAERDPALADAVERLLPARAQPAATTTVSAPRRTALDGDSYRRQVRRIFRSAGYEYGAAGGIVAEVGQIAEQARGFIVADDPESALTLLEAVTEEYSQAWHEHDDSDGELGAFFEELGLLWAEALLEADLPAGEREGWGHQLERWHDEAADYGVEGLWLALRAAEEGWDTPGLSAAMRGEAAHTEQFDDPDSQELTRIRLRVLERKGLTAEALHLAAAADLRLERAMLLLRLGRADEAAQVGAAGLANPNEALALATALRERGRPDLALTVAEAGLRLDGLCGPLASWLTDLAAGLGRTELAIESGRRALLERPALALYRRLEELAGPGWPELRERLLAALRPLRDPFGGQVEIFLAEGLLDEAIAAATRSYDRRQLAQVMDAAIVERPEWVVKAALGLAEPIMNAGEAGRYHEAVDWLRRARAAQISSGRAAEWAEYRKGLAAKHGRKYKLMGMLDELERRP